MKPLLAHVMNVGKELLKMEEILVVNKFPDELPGLPPYWKI